MTSNPISSKAKIITLNQNSGLFHAIDGAIGGLAAGFVCQPLQVIKTAFQITPFSSKKDQKSAKVQGKGFIELTKLIYQTEGIKGFYRGFLPGCIKVSVAAGIYFYLLSYSRIFYSKTVKTKSLCDFVSAMTARGIQTILTNPIIIVKTRFEVIGFNEYKNMFDAFLQIYRKEGFASFFTNGIGVALLKDVPFSAIQFPIYEQVKILIYKLFADNKISTNSSFTKIITFSMSSLVATFISCFITNPLDVIRTRVLFQYYNKNDQQHYKGIMDAFGKMLRNDGIKGFFSGLQTRFIKKIVGAMVLWTVYEYLVDSGKNKHKNAK